MLCAKKKLKFASGDLALLDEIVKADLPRETEPGKFIKDEG